MRSCRCTTSRRDIMQKLAPYDALITPTLTRPAVRLGTLPSNLKEGLRELFAWLLFTYPVQCDRSARVLIAEWLFESGPADRPPNCRASKRRGGYHCACSAIRGSAPVEG